MLDLLILTITILAAAAMITAMVIFRRRPHTRTRLIISSIFYNNLKIKGEITMAQALVKDFLVGKLGIVNHETQEEITATFANESFVSADDSIATVSLDPADGPDTAILDFTGVAEGETDLTIEADATYVDPKTGETVTKHKSVTVKMTVTKPVEETETDLVVTFAPAA